MLKFVAFFFALLIALSAAAPTNTESSLLARGPPPPPPPPPPHPKPGHGGTQVPVHSVETTGPAGSFLVELIQYNGHPFKDHWVYYVQSNSEPKKGVLIHATGDVREGFKLAIVRGYSPEATQRTIKRVPLEWVDGKYFDDKAMMNTANEADTPVDDFEKALFKTEAPGPSLNSASSGEGGKSGRVVQRNCQTWICEAGAVLAEEGIFSQATAKHLEAIKQ